MLAKGWTELAVGSGRQFVVWAEHRLFSACLGHGLVSACHGSCCIANVISWPRPALGMDFAGLTICWTGNWLGWSGNAIRWPSPVSALA
jgi:hypothetical protein